MIIYINKYNKYMLHVDIYLCIYCLTTLGSLSQRKVIEFRSLSNYYTEASEAMIMVMVISISNIQLLSLRENKNN